MLYSKVTDPEKKRQPIDYYNYGYTKNVFSNSSLDLKLMFNTIDTQKRVNCYKVTKFSFENCFSSDLALPSRIFTSSFLIQESVVRWWFQRVSVYCIAREANKRANFSRDTRLCMGDLKPMIRKQKLWINKPKITYIFYENSVWMTFWWSQTCWTDGI